MNLYIHAIAYIYNNILASNKPLCGRGESLGTNPYMYYFIS